MLHVAPQSYMSLYSNYILLNQKNLIEVTIIFPIEATSLKNVYVVYMYSYIYVTVNIE